MVTKTICPVPFFFVFVFLLYNIDGSSLERIGERALKHWIQYTTLIPSQTRSRLLNNTSNEQLLHTLGQSPQTLLSEFPDYLSGAKQLDVPVYTVWGACEDVAILEKFRQGDYCIANLHLLDEASTHVLDIGGVSLRLFGLGGAVVQHKLFDNGEGTDTIAGGLGVMWTTALQIGELVELAQQVYDPSETRVLVTHASPGREGLLAQLALTLHVSIDAAVVNYKIDFALRLILPSLLVCISVITSLITSLPVSPRSIISVIG
jgi:hypothetical protein